MTVSNPTLEPVPSARHVEVEERDSVTIRFCGDSGDGMQLAGTQFTNASAILGNLRQLRPDAPSDLDGLAALLRAGDNVTIGMVRGGAEQLGEVVA